MMWTSISTRPFRRGKPSSHLKRCPVIKLSHLVNIRALLKIPGGGGLPNLKQSPGQYVPSQRQPQLLIVDTGGTFLCFKNNRTCLNKSGVRSPYPIFLVPWIFSKMVLHPSKVQYSSQFSELLMDYLFIWINFSISTCSSYNRPFQVIIWWER